MTTLWVEDTISGARSRLRSFRANGSTVGFVPTMGALHDGHRALMERARAECDAVVVSLFVNPLQFNQRDDFVNYPRDLDADRTTIEDLGVALLFCPSAEEMYPAGEPRITVDPGEIGLVLEGRSRPGHFRGVATVVSKLFAIVDADRAYFGEKDFQQLCLVRALATDLSFRVEVVSCPTVREPDGCALSSRNARLSPEQRQAAPILYRALQVGAGLIAAGERSPSAVERAMADVVGTEALAQLDYAVVRDAATLGELESCVGSLRLLIAANFDDVRLIDNIGLEA